MQIILLILKIIGIILLVIVGLLVLLILAVLFIPVRYDVTGSYLEGSPYLRAKISYAFPLIRLTAIYDTKKTAYIRVLGIKVKDFLAPPKEKKKKKKTSVKKSKDAKAVKEIKEAEDKKSSEISTSQKASEAPEPKVAALTDKAEQETAAQTKDNKNIPEKMKQLWAYVCDMILACTEKVKQLVNKIREAANDAVQKKELLMHYITLWQTPQVQTAFGTAKNTVFKLAKGILPKKRKIFLKIGTGDPAATGQICGFYGMLYPFIGNYVIMEPDFEKSIYEGQFVIRGRIYGFSLVKAALIFLFHKDLKCIRDFILKK